MSAVDVRTLPWSWYTDPAVLQLEHERIFRRSWQYVGHAGDVARAGIVLATSVGDIPVVLVRDREDDAPRVPQRLPPPRLDRLRGLGQTRDAAVPVPRVDLRPRRPPHHRAAGNKEGGIDKDELGLVPLQLDTWGPSLFVNPDAEATPLADFLDGIPERVADAGIDLDALRFLQRSESELDVQLEDLRRELPRVLPLPDRTPGVLRGDGRDPGRVPPRDERAAA